MSNTLLINIKDYLHLYLGCQVLDTKGEPDANISTIISIDKYGECVDDYGNDLPANDVKPILRPLSDMTEEEIEQLNDIELNESSWPTVAYALAPCFKWMLSKHFDLFGLIDSGLAIDKNLVIRNR